MSQPHSKRLLAVVAYLISALCLFWVFRGMDFGKFVHQFETLQPGDLCLAIAFTTAVYFVNSLRWVILLRPLGRVQYWRAVQAVYIGLYLNEVLPLRPGELVRCYLLARWSRFPLSNMFAAAAVERILDGLCMMAGFFVVAVAMKLPKSLVSGGAILAVSLLVITALWFINAARRRAQQNQAAPTTEKAAPGFLDALASMANLRVTLVALAVSALSLICLILGMWFLMKGGRIPLSLAQAAAVFLIIRVATVIPNAPGNIGSYQFFCVLAMGLFGIEKSAAAAFSLLIYSAFTIPLLIGGTIAVLASGLKFKTLLAVREP
jgi:uncharacterized protein (TIRG00374 family)